MPSVGSTKNPAPPRGFPISKHDAPSDTAADLPCPCPPACLLLPLVPPAPNCLLTYLTFLSLSQGGGTAELRSQYAPTIALDSAEQAIYKAVNSDGISARGAAQGSLQDAEVESQYPEHATYADGVRGSITALASGGN